MARAHTSGGADKLKSRKFWITFLVVVIIAFGQMLGLDIDVDRMWALIASTSSYVAGQSFVDRSLAAKALPQLEVTGEILP